VRTDFRERFEAKGRFQGYLATIPVRIITRPDPAFLGLAALGRDKTAAPDASPARD
jgi:glucokinase